MPDFHEVRFPLDVARGARGGPERQTQIVTLASGREVRNSRWAHSRRRYDAGLGIRNLDALAAVVSFHGALVTATPAAPGSIKAKVLVEHGAADSFITPEQIAAFKAEMDQAGADYRFVELPGAKHGFSNPDADAHKGHGLDLGYQKEADERSWADMQALFKEVF